MTARVSVPESIRNDSLRLQERIQGLQDNLAYDYTTNAALLFHSKAQLRGMHMALERVHKGTYGRCQACGGDIEAERLELLPNTPICSACACGRSLIMEGCHEHIHSSGSAFEAQ